MVKYDNKIDNIIKNLGGLMKKNEYQAIAKIIEEKSPCNLLVFGLGHDSYLWNEINKNGKSIFIEDNLDWIKKFKDLEIIHYEYNTQISKANSYSDDELKMQLSLEIYNSEWDIIIVDAPVGHEYPCRRIECPLCPCPGRMSSIYTASLLKNKNSIIIVDDMKRKIEKSFSEKYLGKPNELINQKVGIFKFY